jgi:hypothetical protein
MEQQDRVYVRQSVSLRRDQVAEVKRIAEEDKHHKFSRVVQEALDEFVKRRVVEKELAA